VGDADAVVNFAAESHVDRSIESAEPFVSTNVQGTQTLLDFARAADLDRFVQISTDEVYGEIEEGAFAEDDPLTGETTPSVRRTSRSRDRSTRDTGLDARTLPSAGVSGTGVQSAWSPDRTRRVRARGLLGGSRLVGGRQSTTPNGPAD